MSPYDENWLWHDAYDDRREEERAHTAYMNVDASDEYDDPVAAGSEKPTADFPAKPMRPQFYRGGVDDFDNPAVYAEEDDPRETLGDELEDLAFDLDPRYEGDARYEDDASGGVEPWPPSDEWTRRPRAVLAEVEAAREEAHGDDPPDTGATLGLEVRGG